MQISAMIRELATNLQEHGDIEVYYSSDDEDFGIQDISYDDTNNEICVTLEPLEIDEDLSEKLSEDHNVPIGGAAAVVERPEAGFTAQVTS
jgi:hypothetical protein